MKQLVKITNPGEFSVPDVAEHYGRAITDALARLPDDVNSRVLMFVDGNGLEILLLEDGNDQDAIWWMRQG